MRFLGVDPGGERLGLAVADGTTGVATPLEVVPYRGVRSAAAKLAERARELGAAAVVVGLPTAADGRETLACRRSRALAEALIEHGVAVVLQPEYLTTHEARQRARQAGLRAGRPVDHLAAQIILEDFLATRRDVPDGT